MSDIDYACVTRGPVILVQCSTSSDSFDLFVQEILQKHPISDYRSQFKHGDHFFYILHTPENVSIIVASPGSVELGVIYGILEEIKRLFFVTCASQWKTSESYGLQQEFSTQLKSTVNSARQKKLEKIQSNLQQTQDLMAQNLEKAVARGSDLEEMQRSSEDLLLSSDNYIRTAHSLKMKLVCTKTRWIIFGIVAAAALLIIIIITVNTSENKK